MKAIRILFLGLIIIFFSTSCYTTDCAGEVGLFIKLNNYPTGEYSFVIEQFSKNGNLGNLISRDTNTIQWASQGSGESFGLGYNPNGSNEVHDYNIILLDDNNTFSITDLEVDRDYGERKFGLYRTHEQLVCPYKSINVTGPKVSLDGNTIMLSK